jgi:hypothetical protein
VRSGYEFDAYGRRAARPDRDPEQHLAAFLSKVADVAAPQLSPAARSRLLETLRQGIEQERAANGRDVRTLDRILTALGDPITLVDAEVQRDPESQQALAARLSRTHPSGAGAVDAELAKQLAPDPHGHGPVHPVGPPGSGPEICLDPDPFAAAIDYRPETVGALNQAAQVPTGEIGPPLPPAEEDPGAVGDRLRSFWAGGPRVHPVESAAIVLLLAGAAMGQWLFLVAGGLVAFASRFYSPVEKWLLVVGVPAVSFLLFSFGFWLTRHGKPGGTVDKPVDLLSGMDSFFGAFPRMIAVLGALFLAWRLARGVIRRT